MNIDFHPAAAAEFTDAIDYYESAQLGLGSEFAAEVYDALERIKAHPHAWPQVRGGIRRVLLKRFPHGVLYAQEGEDIHVVALMHLHRSPDYWRSRG